MSKSSDAANAMMYSIGQVCDLYRVEYLRMQSRTVIVPGAAGRSRPMFFGAWRDQFGNTHRRGMADMLVRPRVPVGSQFVTMLLWVEAKSGAGKLNHDQLAFKSYVESNGEYWMELHDTTEPLERWFKEHSVSRDNRPAITKPASVPIGEVSELPCRHCKARKAEHTGSILACRAILGKVYSPLIPRH